MQFAFARRNLWRNSRRTFAVVATVAMGVGSLFLFHGFNTGIMNQYRDNTIHARYGHGQVFTQGYRDAAHAKPWQQWISDWRTLDTELRAIPAVQELFPRVGFAALLRNGEVSVSGHGQGVDGLAESRFFTTLNVEQGKLLEAEPDRILLGRGLARALGVAVGDPVTLVVTSIAGEMRLGELSVVGVFHTGAADFDNTVFRVPLVRAQELLGTDRVESITLALDSVESWDAVRETVESRHPELEAIPFATLDRIYYQHSVDWLQAQFGVIQVIIVLIVVLGIFNSVSSSILERKAEIGNLRANGESSTEVLVLLGIEGAMLGLLGAVAGCLITVGLDLTLLRDGILMPPAPGITRQFHVLIELQPGMAVQTASLGMAATLFGTLAAGWKVARMPIGAALRTP
jgi:putative ABC transport system permease protein